MDVKQEIREFVINNFLFGASEHNFADDDSFMETGIIDSTGVLELVSFVEERFEIEVEDRELIPDNLDSASKLAQYVTRKLGARSSR